MNNLTPIQALIAEEIRLACRGELPRDQSILIAANYRSTIAEMLARICDNGKYQHCCVGDFRIMIVTQDAFAIRTDAVLGQLHALAQTPYFKQSIDDGRDLVVIEVGPDAIDFCSAQVHGAKHVHIDGNGHIRNTLIHELTHAFCTTGNRFIDEGLAMLMEYELAGTLKDFDGVMEKTPRGTHFAEYRKDIIEMVDAGLFLSDEQKYSPYYIKAMNAMRLVSEHVEAQRLFTELAGLSQFTSGLQHYDMLVELIAEPRLDTHAPGLNLPSAAQVTEAVVNSFLSDNSANQIADYLHQFEAYNLTKLPTDQLLSFCRLSVRKLQQNVTRDKSGIKREIANIRYLLGSREVPVANPLYHILLAQLEALEIQLAESVMDINRKSERYRKWIDEAESIDPEAPEVIFESAIADYYAARYSTDSVASMERMQKKMLKLIETPYARIAEARMTPNR